jgi:hypothetical protein
MLHPEAVLDPMAEFFLYGKLPEERLTKCAENLWRRMRPIET